MQQVLTWTAIGLVVGWMVRTAMRSRAFGLLGDLITGSLGALVGGWLFRKLSIIAPDNAAGHVAVALFGAGVLLGALRVLYRVTSVTSLAPLAQPGLLVTDLEAQVRRLSEFERRIFTSVLQRQPAAQDPNRAFDAQLTFGDRIADRVAAFGGSWTFIGLFFMMMIGWMALNEQFGRPFDPYPYILLNLVLSCLAALQAPIIMMSQNRQAAKDRSDARSDYEVNLRAEMQILTLHEKLDAARGHEWARLARLAEEQGQLLRQLEERLTSRDGPRQ